MLSRRDLLKGMAGAGILAAVAGPSIASVLEQHPEATWEAVRGSWADGEEEPHDGAFFGTGAVTRPGRVLYRWAAGIYRPSWDRGGRLLRD